MKEEDRDNWKAGPHSDWGPSIDGFSRRVSRFREGVTFTDRAHIQSQFIFVFYMSSVLCVIFDHNLVTK